MAYAWRDIGRLDRQRDPGGPHRPCAADDEPARLGHALWRADRFRLCLDHLRPAGVSRQVELLGRDRLSGDRWIGDHLPALLPDRARYRCGPRSEEHTSELQSLMRNSYAVFCLKKKKNNNKIYIK